MKALLKVTLTLALVFASTFVIVKSTGALSIEDIEFWLESAKSISPVYVASIVIALLFADLFIAVPTLTVTILSGFFLGHAMGAGAAIAGLVLAGLCGYGLSYVYGGNLVLFLIKDKHQRDEARAGFKKHGVVMILFSRALPILPEISACMAGMTHMKFRSFLMAWCMSTIPYALIATYAGSISTVDNPKPAIFTAIGLTSFFWLGWLVIRKKAGIPVTRTNKP